MPDIIETLKNTPRGKRNLGPQAFDWQANQNGVRSRIGRLRAEVAHKLLGRPSDKSLEVAIPAYETLGTTDGTGGDQESFTVSHGIIDSPNTDPVVLWLDGDYYGSPDNDDFVSTGSVDVTDPSTGSTVHAFYIPNKAGTLEIEKAVDGSTSKSTNLKTLSLKNVHAKDFSENAEYFDLSGGEFKPFVAGDMTLDVYVNAPYITRYTDPDGDGAVATNTLLNFTALKAESSVPGLKAAVADDM